VSDLLVTNIGELVTNDPAHGGLLGIIEGAALAVVDGSIAWFGSEGELPPGHLDLPIHDAGGASVVPGFVDPHTHIVFAGDRSEEFSRRLAGESYEEILAAGGGILSTVEATRAASGNDLFDDAAARASRMLAAGTTTVEVKSGYGLEVDDEAKQLAVAARVDAELPIDVVPTFLGAHVVPAEYRDRRDEYIDLVCTWMLEACAPLATFADVFCDEAAFTVDEARRILEASAERGLALRLHADQLGRIAPPTSLPTSERPAPTISTTPPPMTSPGCATPARLRCCSPVCPSRCGFLTRMAGRSGTGESRWPSPQTAIPGPHGSRRCPL